MTDINEMPDTNQVSKLALEWVQEWADLMGVKHDQ